MFLLFESMIELSKLCIAFIFSVGFLFLNLQLLLPNRDILYLHICSGLFLIHVYCKRGLFLDLKNMYIPISLSFYMYWNLIDLFVFKILDGDGAPPRAPPASKEVVAKLPIIILSDEILAKLGHDADCAICKENLVSGDKMQELPCKHTFHPPCLKPWLVLFLDSAGVFNESKVSMVICGSIPLDMYIYCLFLLSNQLRYVFGWMEIACFL